MKSPYMRKQVAGFHLSITEIVKIEELKGATFIGSFCTKRPSDGSYNDYPVDVFYQPDHLEPGYSEYFGIHRDMEHRILICDASSAFDEPLVAAVCDDGELLISRSRHDYVERKGAMIDGGRAYTKTNGCSLLYVVVRCGIFFWKREEDGLEEFEYALPIITVSHAELKVKPVADAYTTKELPDSMTSTFKVVLTAEQEEELRIQKEFLDPENRAWEYDAAGVRVFKGTRTPFTGDMK